MTPDAPQTLPTTPEYALLAAILSRPDIPARLKVFKPS